jgi:peptide deformylase
VSLTILTEGDPILRQKSRPINNFGIELRQLAQEMLDTMYQAQGVGLAAPQVGITEQLIVLAIEGVPMTIINPQIIAQSGAVTIVEGCLSVPGRNEPITRPEQIKVVYQNLAGKEVVTECDGLLARVIQHEVDHLQGVLFIDYLKEPVVPRRRPWRKE